jgi:hypothetical protein
MQGSDIYTTLDNEDKCATITIFNKLSLQHGFVILLSHAPALFDLEKDKNIFIKLLHGQNDQPHKVGTHRTQVSMDRFKRVTTEPMLYIPTSKFIFASGFFVTCLVFDRSKLSNFPHSIHYNLFRISKKKPTVAIDACPCSFTYYWKILHTDILVKVRRDTRQKIRMNDDITSDDDLEKLIFH